MTRRELMQGAIVASLLKTPQNSQLVAGAGKRIITPNPLLPVSGGMGPTHPTREKKGVITARALYLRKGDVAVAVVGLDLLGFPMALGDRVRARVARIPAQNILIRSTHSTTP